MRTSIWIVGSLVLASFATTAHADTVSMMVKGAKSGDIKGSVKEKGREGAMTCTEFGLEVSAPRDAVTGRATGKRQYAPVRCLKRVDRASPLLFRALTNNEQLPEVSFQVLGPVAVGGAAPKPFYSVVLKSAFVAGLRQFVDPSGVLMEELTFSFALITVTWADGDISAVDDLYLAK